MTTAAAMKTDRSEKTRLRILAHARQVFLERGFRKVTVEEICAALGMSKRTFYRHFPDRDALAVDVVSEMLGRHAPEIAENLTSGKPVDEVLTTHFDLLANRILAHVSTQLLSDVQTLLPDLWERIDTVRLEAVRILTDQLRRGQAEGTIRRNIDPEAMGKLIQGVVSNLGTPAFLTAQDLTLGQFIETFKNLLLYGVLQPDPGEFAHETAHPG